MEIQSVPSISHKIKLPPEEPATTSGSSLRAVLEGLMKGEDVPRHKAVVCSSGDCFLLFEIPQTIFLTTISEKH